MATISRSFLEAIPKTDVHVHLDGSLRLATLIELARDHKVNLPSLTEAGLKELIFKDRYRNLPEYLAGFQYTVAVMQTPEAIERIAYELAEDNFNEGVCYIEPRFAPQLHINSKLSAQEVLAAADRGLLRAQKNLNARKEVKSGQCPPFAYGIIGCALRMFTPQFSHYYQILTTLHAKMPEVERFSLASLELARELVAAREEKGVAVVGFDLAGAEKGYPAEDHRKAYLLAHRHFLKKTVHAGEAFGPPSIFQAITDCHADRIGHGTNLFDETLVDLPTPEERRRYVQALAQYIADQRITIELCLTSNLQTIPSMTLAKHPFGKMLESKLSTTFCTDNRLVSHTTVTDEIAKAVEAFSITPSRLKDLIIYGFKRSFYPGGYIDKRKYVRQVINTYERLEREYKIT